MLSDPRKAEPPMAQDYEFHYFGKYGLARYHAREKRVYDGIVKRKKRRCMSMERNWKVEEGGGGHMIWVAWKEADIR